MRQIVIGKLVGLDNEVFDVLAEFGDFDQTDEHPTTLFLMKGSRVIDYIWFSIKKPIYQYWVPLERAMAYLGHHRDEINEVRYGDFEGEIEGMVIDINDTFIYEPQMNTA